MIAVKLNIHESDLPKKRMDLRHAIEALVPVGSGGVHRNTPAAVSLAMRKLDGDYKRVCEGYPMLRHESADRHMGTLGSGNHFIELSRDESEKLWIVVHSGSRGIGTRLAQTFIDRANRRVDANGRRLGGIGWLPEDDPDFWPYVRAVEFGQKVAALNCELMLDAVLAAVRSMVGKSVVVDDHAINCHHNYIAKETHFGDAMWITRKGAIRAGLGELGIIPSSMGGITHIVRGLGAEASYCSCSHGAGRALSRSAAKAMFTVDDLARATAGVECRISKSLVDETPQAYKPIKEVMKWQAGLVESVHQLKALICVKGE